MKLSKAWIIALRDFKIFRRQKMIWYSILIFPIITAVIFPLVMEFGGGRTGGILLKRYPMLLDAFSFFFVIGAAFIPLTIASYSIVGEKIEKSLEPLLATPILDSEILLGKTISAFVPVLISMYTGATVFMALMDEVTYGKLGYFYFPNWSIATLLLVLVPVAIILGVEYSVIISSRVNDVRSATGLGIFMFLPFIGIYLASEIGVITLDTNTILIISGIILAIDVLLFFIATATFNREEILTKWK